MPAIDSAITNVLAQQQASLANQVSMAVQAKTLDAARQQGDAVNALLEQAVQLGKSLTAGKVFDSIA